MAAGCQCDSLNGLDFMNKDPVGVEDAGSDVAVEGDITVIDNIGMKREGIFVIDSVSKTSYRCI